MIFASVIEGTLYLMKFASKNFEKGNTHPHIHVGALLFKIPMLIFFGIFLP
jgi:hypothetical protein